jgi:TfoX/Sxy family transcriptional regulator of competence genes
MPYNQEIDDRLNKIIADWHAIEAKKMFGGVCHLLKGNMFCGVYKDFLILRLGVEKAKTALKQPPVRPFDITGRAMKGWVMVADEGFRTDHELKAWLKQAKAFAETLPSK